VSRALARAAAAAILACLLTAAASAQDPTGAIEGVVTDRGAAVVAAAKVTVTNSQTGFTRTVVSDADGFFRVPAVPVGVYNLVVEAPRFATFSLAAIQVNVNQAVRVDVRLAVGSVAESVTVAGRVQLVETSSNALGAVVSGREIVDLPLNGRNFTQLGLLQTGVAPLTAGVATAGGSLREGQAYAVNGMRPEQNVYLVDGAQNINRMDGGYALKLPVDAVAEFRIMTQSAPPEFGGTGGATTSVVTRSGGNQYHGSLYEFVRNDAFDARNYFSESVEPLKQNQFGVTTGGPIVKDRVMFFGYYEGFRNDQGITTSSTVPTPGQRRGDFSDLGYPLINVAAGGVPIPGNKIPAAAINPVALNVINLYPLGNVSPSIYRATLMGRNYSDQAGGRVDVNVSSSDQLFGRYSYSGGYDINPVSVRGTDVPGFPTRDDLATQSAALSENHVFSSAMLNSMRGSYLRHKFFFDQRLNQTPPSALGFTLTSANSEGQGPPFFNVSGYSPIGGAITGPRNSTQNLIEFADALSWTNGRHLVKFGGGYQHTGIDMFQAIAPNAFYVFAGTFPTNNAVANLLLGAPVTFYQGLGNFDRDISVWGANAYAQDEWRLNGRLTFNYGLRYERINPITEAQNRLTGFIPGVQSVVYPSAPKGLVFPGDPGIPDGIAQSANGVMPRLGLAWDPNGAGVWSVRASYGLFYDQFQNGAGTASQVPISSIPWAQFNQFSGQGLNFQNPYLGHTYPAPNTFVRPSTVFTIDTNAKPPYTQDWNVSVQRVLFDKYMLEVRYVGANGQRLPRNIEDNPAVYGPGATAQNADRRRIYANCPSDGGTCDFSTIAMLSYITHANYEAGQVSLSRRFSGGVGFNVSYWLSSTKDELSSMNLSGAAAKSLAGENDLAQNPFDLGAEYGPSLFDARHRLVASGSWAPRVERGAPAVRAVFDGWQINGIATFNSGTPFTVTDSANVSLQANSPPISGFVAARPNQVGDPNAGPHTVDQWMSPSAFQRLDPVTQAGQFGNEGRNSVRGPGYADIDVSLVKNIELSPSTRLELRIESFNITNFTNLGLPVADLNSANFGRILSAGPPRLMQFAVKLIF
jgi:hypothetical protein